MKTLFLSFIAIISFQFFSNAQITVAKPVNNNRAEIKPAAPKAIAFRLSPFTNPMSLPANGPAAGTVLNLAVKEFDLGNNISGNSFITPENGVYHFDIRLNITYPVTDYQDYLRFYLMLNKNGAAIEKTFFMNPQTDKTPFHTLTISTTVLLKKGDTITASYNADANSASKYATATEVSFSGFKVSGMDGVATGSGTIK